MVRSLRLLFAKEKNMEGRNALRSLCSSFRQVIGAVGMLKVQRADSIVWDL